MKDHEHNRAHWDAIADEYRRQPGPEPWRWGLLEIDESDIGALGEVEGLDVLELGCGAGAWLVELCRRGARPVGVDVSPRQLQHARSAMREAGVDVPLVLAPAEDVPLPDASFDLVFCDHGGLTYGDPGHTVPEVARLLRSGGRLAFNTTSPLAEVCRDRVANEVGQRLRHSWDALGRLEDDGAVTWVLPHAAWIELLVAHGLDVVALHELRDRGGAGWPADYPPEDLWVATRR